MRLERAVVFFQRLLRLCRDYNMVIHDMSINLRGLAKNALNYLVIFETFHQLNSIFILWFTIYTLSSLLEIIAQDENLGIVQWLQWDDKHTGIYAGMTEFFIYLQFRWEFSR